MSLNLPKVPLVLQKNRYECGLSALRMIFLYYGDRYALDHISDRESGSEKCYTAKELIEISKRMGYASACLKMSMCDLQRLKMPCIVYQRGKHFVVYVGVKNGQVICMDPAYGKRCMDIEEFCKRYQNIVIIIKPLKKVKKKRWIAHAVRFEKHSFFIFLCMINMGLCFNFIRYTKINSVYTLIFILAIGLTEKLVLKRSKIIGKTKYYKDSLLGQPILFFACEENGFSTNSLVDEYIDYIVNQSGILNILFCVACFDNIADVIQISSIILCGLLMRFVKENQFIIIVSVMVILGALACLNAIFREGIHLFYSFVTVYLCCRIYLYDIKVERLKRKIDEANLEQLV